MSITSIPTEPTQTPCGPEVVDLPHLSITQRWASGSTHNIHLLETSDLGVILAQGQGKHVSNRVCRGEVGTVIVSLSVDEDHDEVQFDTAAGVGAEEAITQALEALIAAANALKRVRKA